MSGPTLDGLMHALQVEATLVGLNNFSSEREPTSGHRVLYLVKFGTSQAAAGSPAAYVRLEIPFVSNGRIHVIEVRGDRAVKGNGERLMKVLIQAARNAQFTLLTANPQSDTGKALAKKLRITEDVPGEWMFRGLTL